MKKIVLEEHLSTELNNIQWNSAGEAIRNGKTYMEEIDKRLLDISKRIAEMDENGIEISILSLTSPGAQSILDASKATSFAQKTNDEIYEKFISKNPERFYAFATVALQSPKNAVKELERTIKEYGFKGVLINGYTNIGNQNTALYLDEEIVWEFWDKVAELNVPVYLHPREPLSTQCRIYEGYSSLIGSAWAFAHETATHAIRLMLCGLFDKYPNLTIILGHLGEGLPLMLPRLEHRLKMQREGEGLGIFQRKNISEYFTNNFYVTTSGHFHTKSLLNTISEIGMDRVMFSTDYPYESMKEASEWLDHALISDNDRIKIGRTNAAKLFNLS